MTVCWKGQGHGFHAEGRGRGRSTGFTGFKGLPPLRACREPASRRSLAVCAAGYAGGISGAGGLAGGLAELAGGAFVYALAGADAGKECRWRLPGLTVAINLCENEVRRIVPGASAEI